MFNIITMLSIIFILSGVAFFIFRTQLSRFLKVGGNKSMIDILALFLIIGGVILLVT